MTTYTLIDSLMAAGYSPAEAYALMDKLAPQAHSMAGLTLAVHVYAIAKSGV